MSMKNLNGKLNDTTKPTTPSAGRDMFSDQSRQCWPFTSEQMFGADMSMIFFLVKSSWSLGGSDKNT